MTIEGYYNECIQKAKREILGKDKDYILGVETEELVEYYATSFMLPKLDVDFSRGEYDVDETPRTQEIPIKFRFPVRAEPRIEEVLIKRSNPYIDGFQLVLDGDRLVVSARVPTNVTDPDVPIKNALEAAKRQIGYKNQNVEEGNSRIRDELKDFVKILKAEYQKRDAIVKLAIQNVPIKLERRPKGTISVDFRVKKSIAPVMPHVRDREKELVLAEDKVDAVVDLLGNGGRSFETTPKIYSRMEEEELRDILLGWLNAVFEGEATGETFSKMGKTDIHLKLSKGDILIVECKIWNGEKYLSEGIDQLFDYLTWRESFGICMTFCKLKSFSDIVGKAKNVVREHRSYVHDSIEEHDTTHFTAFHFFPDDQKKKVKVYYLLFNLYYDERALVALSGD